MVNAFSRSNHPPSLVDLPIQNPPRVLMIRIADAFAEVSRGNKIYAIKAIRSAIGCGLKEAKDIVEGTFA
jgi:Ribosomal protein L7/L12 C-terminal domain